MSKNGFPIDAIMYHHMSSLHGTHILLSGEFEKKREPGKQGVQRGMARFVQAIEHLDEMFDVKTTLLYDAKIRETDAYHQIHRELVEKTREGFSAMRLRSATQRDGERFPESYVLGKAAVVKLLARQGYRMKVSMHEEYPQDVFALTEGVNLGLAYLPPAYALGTGKESHVVNPHLPDARSASGQRLVLGDSEEKTMTLIQMSSPDAVRALAHLAMESAELRGNVYSSIDAFFSSMAPRHRKKAVARLIVEQIVRPFNALC